MKVIDKAREEIASRFIVLCEDCLHGKNFKDDCPHLDEDICMWQRELADEITNLSFEDEGKTYQIGVCGSSRFIETFAVNSGLLFLGFVFSLFLLTGTDRLIVSLSVLVCWICFTTYAFIKLKQEGKVEDG